MADLFITNEFSEIPEIFHSDATGRLFSNCLVCDCYLLDHGVPYVIEKAIRNYTNFQNSSDTIFEYAMCLQCMETFRKQVSEESQQKLDEYMSQRVDFLARRQKYVDAENFDVEDWTSNCIVNGKLGHKVEERQIYCQCDGDKMLFTYMPFMLSGDAMQEMANLLSKKTIGEIGDFMNEHFDLSPELKINPVDSPLLIF